jgi:hypothetical protein
VRKVVIVLVVALGLLVALDFGAAAAAEYQVSTRLRSHLGLPEDPAVRINGFPFLLQAAFGDYREVEITADRVTVARLDDIGVEATLHHVRVPFSQLVSGTADTVPIDEVVGRARIRASELGKLINVDDLTVEEITDRDRTLAANAGKPLPANAVKLAATTKIGGQPTKVIVIASLGLASGQVEVTAHSIQVDGQYLPPVVERPLLTSFTVRIDPGMLPFGVTPTSVRSDKDTVIVEGIARNVVLHTGGTTG